LELFDSPTAANSHRQNDIRLSAAKSKEKIRINALKILKFDSQDDAIINESLQVALAFARALQFSYGLTPNDILLALQDAHRAADEYYTIRHAMEWDTSFIIPAEAIAADSVLFRNCNYNFSQMCRYKQSKLAHNRLSVSRIIDLFGTDGKKVPGVDPADVNILLEFAQHGITPPVADNFRPESVNVAPLRDRYIKLQHTINKLLYKLYQDGTMIFLKKHEALRIPGIHLSPQHHADTKGKPEGRIIGDLSGQHDAHFTPLNGSAGHKDKLRDTIEQQWGVIRHPTVDMLVKMVLTSADLHGWDNIILWKKDLKGAFNLLNYNPDFCQLFAFPLTDDIVVIHLAGLFGWIGMPHAFQVLTRTLQVLCRHIISGLCYWYVDDLMAVSLRNLYINDSTLVDSNVQHLLGTGSIAATKSQHGRMLEFLGWEFNLDTRSITLCTRNMNKLVHALFSFEPTAKISISHIQRLASLISRASILSKHMRPYTVTLHAITSGYDQPHVRIQLSVLAQSDVMMWRAFVLLLIANPDKLSRTMESFRPQTAQFCIKYDASLTGLGVGIYNVLNDTLLTYSALELPFQVTNESKRQNTMEFVAVIFGLLLAWKLQLKNFSYTLHGDNMSSLAWAQADRVNSTLARRANIVFTTISMHINASLSETQHIPGIMNVLFDGLSRNISPTELGLDPTLMFNAAADISILRFVQLCDPALELSDIASHIDLLHQCTKLLLT
jgi:hypothetical protein